MKFNVTVSKHVYHAWSESDMEEKKDLENMGFRIEKGKASNDHYYLDPNTPPIIVDLTTMEDLLCFIKKWGGDEMVVVHLKGPTIEIYNDYREG